MRVLGAVNARPQPQATAEPLNPFAAGPTAAGAILPAGNATGDQQEHPLAAAEAPGVQPMELGPEQPVLGAAPAVQQPEQAQGQGPQAQAAIGWRVTLPFEGMGCPWIPLGNCLLLPPPWVGAHQLNTCMLHEQSDSHLQQASPHHFGWVEFRQCCLLTSSILSSVVAFVVRACLVHG